MTIGLALVLAILALLGAGFFIYERRPVHSRELALIVSLAAIAGAARVPFAWIPSVQPTTFIVLYTGYVFGPLVGYVTGVAAAFISNCLLVQGPWTIWQMFCWGMVGVSGGCTAFFVRKEPRPTLLILGFLWGFLFGWIMNLWHWFSFVYPLNLQTWMSVNAASVLFDFAHALGNVFFIFFFGRPLLSLLARFKKKLLYQENE